MGNHRLPSTGKTERGVFQFMCVLRRGSMREEGFFSFSAARVRRVVIGGERHRRRKKGGRHFHVAAKFSRLQIRQLWRNRGNLKLIVLFPMNSVAFFYFLLFGKCYFPDRVFTAEKKVPPDHSLDRMYRVHFPSFLASGRTRKISHKNHSTGFLRLKNE